MADAVSMKIYYIEYASRFPFILQCITVYDFLRKICSTTVFISGTYVHCKRCRLLEMFFFFNDKCMKHIRLLNDNWFTLSRSRSHFSLFAVSERYTSISLGGFQFKKLYILSDWNEATQNENMNIFNYFELF